MVGTGWSWGLAVVSASGGSTVELVVEGPGDRFGSMDILDSDKDAEPGDGDCDACRGRTWSTWRLTTE